MSLNSRTDSASVEGRGNPELQRQANKEEVRFLKIILSDKTCLMDAIACNVKPGKDGHFWGPKTRFLYDKIYEHYEKHGALLTRSAMESLLASMSCSDEDKAAGLNFWSEVWSNSEASVEDYNYLKENINGRYIQWQLVTKIRNNYDKIQTATTNQSKLVKDFQQDVMSIDNVEPDAYSLAVTVKDGFKDAIAYVKEKRDNPQMHRGVFSGIRAVDKIFNGFDYGTYTVISGMVNGGKTTFMFNLANNMALAGYSVVYVSLEKKASLFWRRLLCLNALCDYNRIKRGGKGEFGVSDIWFERLQQAERDVAKMSINFECLQFLPKVTSLTKILSRVDKILSQKKVDVLFVDYLGAIGWEVNFQGRPDLNLADVHQKLMAYGKNHNLVTITANQLKNESTRIIRKQAKKASLDGDLKEISVNTEDLGGSQHIVADADNAIGLVLSEEKPATSIALHVAKARDDVSHMTVNLLFDGAIGRIHDPEVSPSDLANVETMIYDAGLTEDQLKCEDTLFSEFDKQKESEQDKTSSLATESIPEEKTPEKTEEKTDNKTQESPKEEEDLFDEKASEKSSNEIPPIASAEKIEELPKKSKDNYDDLFDERPSSNVDSKESLSVKDSAKNEEILGELDGLVAEKDKESDTDIDEILGLT